jgi:hypothetical protein
VDIEQRLLHDVRRINASMQAFIEPRGDEGSQPRTMVMQQPRKDEPVAAGRRLEHPSSIA